MSQNPENPKIDFTFGAVTFDPEQIETKKINIF